MVEIEVEDMVAVERERRLRVSGIRGGVIILKVLLLRTFADFLT